MKIYTPFTFGSTVKAVALKLFNIHKNGDVYKSKQNFVYIHLFALPVMASSAVYSHFNTVYIYSGSTAIGTACHTKEICSEIKFIWSNQFVVFY